MPHFTLTSFFWFQKVHFLNPPDFSINLYFHLLNFQLHQLSFFIFLSDLLLISRQIKSRFRNSRCLILIIRYFILIQWLLNKFGLFNLCWFKAPYFTLQSFKQIWSVHFFKSLYRSINFYFHFLNVQFHQL